MKIAVNATELAVLLHKPKLKSIVDDPEKVAVVCNFLLNSCANVINFTLLNWLASRPSSESSAMGVTV
jgi:hypothetical protein